MKFKKQSKTKRKAFTAYTQQHLFNPDPPAAYRIDILDPIPDAQNKENL